MPKCCSIEGCEKPVLSRGWCPMHYARWYKHGDPLTIKHRHDGNRVDPTQAKTCAECGIVYHPRARCSHEQWARSEYCSTVCANTWRAKNYDGAGARFSGGAEHGQKVAAGMAASPRYQEAKARKAKRLAKAARRRANKQAQRSSATSARN